MVRNKLIYILIVALICSTKSFGQQQDMDSVEIITIIKSMGIAKKSSEIPSCIVDFLSEKLERKFKMKKLGRKIGETDLDMPGRYFSYRSCVDSFFLLSYVKVGYSSNTHVLIFDIKNEKSKKFASIITAGHHSIDELKRMVVEQSFKIIHAPNF